MALVANDLQVTIEYDSRGKRVTKHFEDVYAGKRFYIAKMKDGKNPAVVNGATPDDWKPADPETDALNAAVAEGQAARATGPAILKVPGVSLGKTRSYDAGRIIAQFGHAAGCTPELVAALDAAHQKPNAIESEISIRNSWHAIRGFCEELGIPVPAGHQAAQGNA